MWPAQATISFQNLSMKYREDLPIVLNNLNFHIKDGEKAAIVGRTGSGKSSIIQTLFRMTEPIEGSTYQLGGYDALKMGLGTLRRSISIIPQVPFLFKGSVRQNLDPFEEKSDKEIWRALKISQLEGHVLQFSEGLKT